MYNRFNLQPSIYVILLLSLLGMLLTPATLSARRVSAKALADQPIYTDTLAAGWADWSWGTTTTANSAAPVHSGGNAYAVQYTTAWGGFFLHAAPVVSTAGYTHLRFWIHGGANGGQKLNIVLNGSAANTVAVTAPANTWTQIDAPLADLGNPATIADIYWQDTTGGAQPTFYLDDIALVGPAQPPPPANVTIQIDDTAAGTAIDPRILGTNMAAWSKPLLTNPTFIARTKASGVSVIRIPGGSWSNGYGWLSCEMGTHVANAEPCRAPDRQGGFFDIFWAAKPTDWVNFLKAVGIEGMYVVNPNGTPQEAAAAVAFFNATADDPTVIGVDTRGKDWLTAGHWAQLRADNGNAEPLGIKLWAVGNEIYAGTQCNVNGWEPIWTCEGSDYVNGATVNNVVHGGYLAFRDAMRAVDSTILVGAVGDSPGSGWGNWGNEVVTGAGAVMDFYDVHAYAYWDIPTDHAQILAHPHSFWAAIMTDLKQTFAQRANNRAIPVALTEYNLGLEFKDTNQQMTRAVNGLFMADTLGQLISQGYTMANQFLLASGDQVETGTDFGLLRPDHNWQRSPQYFAYHLWSRFGATLLPVTSSANAATQLSVYGGRIDANTLSLLVINKQNNAIATTIDLKSATAMTTGSADVAQATALNAQSMSLNSITENNLADELANAPSTALDINGATLDYIFAPYSLTLLQLEMDGAEPGEPTATPTATPTPTPTLTPLPPADIDLMVDVNANRKPISADIYGIHYADDESFAAAIDLPVRRWGGNDKTRYNWQNDMYGNPDWYFENEHSGVSADQFIAQSNRTKTASIITIPLIGYVAKDPGQVGDSATYPCSFDIRTYNYVPHPVLYGDGSIARPATDPDDPKRAHCGTGITGYQNNDPTKPIYLAGNNPLDTSLAIGPAWATDWVAHLQQQFGTAANGGVRFYSLDNEPDIWFETHRDVAPTALTLQKLRDDSIAYAAAIKAADPAALTLGPVVHGWTYYWHSPSDGQAQAWETRPNRKANGDFPLVPWYLKQMANYEQQNGVRLLDYLDLHYYVAAGGVSQQDAGDADTQARRLRSTRSLWDPTYVDESWIATAPVADENGQVADYNVVRLIPRMKEWVAANYPGTKLAITEYNWGALDHINGALTQADVLGIFGREGLDMALLFDSAYSAGGKFTPTGPGAYAFRIYRNYDGQGSQFGDTSLQATSSDQSKLAIYAAQRNRDGALTFVVINKTDGDLSANLSITNLPANLVISGPAQRYRYSAANLNAIVGQPDQLIAGNAFHSTFPANSITLLIVPTAIPAPGEVARGVEKLYLPVVQR